MMKRLCSFSLLLISLNLFSQDNLLTLEQAVYTALQNNYDILLAKNDSTAFAIDRSYTYAAFLPRLNATASKSWNNTAQKQELANGTKRDTSGIKSTNLQAALNLNWILFDGMKMFITRDRIYELEKLGALNVKDQVVNTVVDVVTNYYGIVRQKQQLKAIIELMSINEERVKLADKKLSVGLGAKPELLQAKIDLNAQIAEKLRQETVIQQLKERLNQLMAVELKSNYEVVDTIPINGDLQYGQFQEGIENTNPSILIARKNIDIANLVMRERKAERWPVLTFNSAYNFTRQENKVVINNFTPLFNQNKGLNFSFNLNVPIFNNFNTRRLIEQAQLDVRYQELFLKNQMSLIDVQLSNAFKNYEMEKRQLALEEDNIMLAKENVTIALERFRQGVSILLELREAQRSLEDAYNRLIAARYNTKLSEIQLHRLRGEIVR
jgi:outer membrane protein